jgi:hypothetical protein
MSTQPYPVRLVGGDDLGRSRLTVLVRLILIIPHVIVVWAYGIAALVVVIISWFAALFTGRVPDGMHEFIAGYMRYYTRVLAYGSLAADPYPPFGPGGGYPVDLDVDPPVAQNRLTVLFRIILVIPCYLLVAYILQPVAAIVSIICWFAALFTGRVPQGLQNALLFCLRFGARTFAYFYLVNPRYPAFSGDPSAPSLPVSQGALPPLP